MKKSVLISIIILLLLVGIFLIASNAITKYTGFAVTGNVIKEKISQEECEPIKTNKNTNNLNPESNCNKGG